MTGASGACLISHHMPKLNSVSISQEASSGQTIGANGCLIAHCMPNLHGISISEGADWSMIGAADVAFISSCQGISIPQIPSTNMIRAADVGYISSYQGISIPQARNPSQTIGATGVSFISSLQGILIPQTPSNASMVGAADACFTCSHQGILVPQSQNCGHRVGGIDVGSQVPSSGHAIGVADGGFTSSNQSILIPRSPSGAHAAGAANVGSCQGISIPKALSSALLVAAADVGFTSCHQGISIPQVPGIGHWIGGADVGFNGDKMAGHCHVSFVQSPKTGRAIGASPIGASPSTGQQSSPTLHQGSIPGQAILESGVDFSKPPITTSLHDTPTSRGQPDTGEMIAGDVVDDYMVDIEEFPSEYDLSIIDSLNAIPPIKEPSSTTAAVSRSLPLSFFING